MIRFRGKNKMVGTEKQQGKSKMERSNRQNEQSRPMFCISAMGI